MGVLDLDSIECGVKAQYTTLFHVQLGRKKDIRGKNDSQGVRVQVLELDDRVEVGNEECGIHQSVHRASAAVAIDLRTPARHLDRHRFEHLRCTQQGVPVLGHGAVKLCPLNGVPKLCDARQIDGAAEVR